jgi:molybdopterin converting factor small subunit
MTDPQPLRIHVHLLSLLKRYAPGERNRFTLAVEEPVCVGDIIARLAIPGDTPRIALRNGRWADGDTRLVDGDVVTLMPPVDGG